VPGPFLPKSKYVDQVLEGNCLDLLAKLPDNCIDLVLCDLPYGTTQNKWDSVIDLEALWAEYHRVAKHDAAFVLTAAQPFTSILVTSNLAEFKVEWIWQKTIGSGQLNIAHQPLRVHESVLVFYRARPSYHPQMTDGTPYKFTRRAVAEGPGYGAQRDVDVDNPGQRHPKTVLEVPNPRIKGGHPTQKPLALFEYFIRTYSDPGDLVLDNCLGAGTTALAALRTARHFVGMELEPKYVTMANDALAAYRASLTK